MGTPSVIDLDALLAPISESEPAGTNLGEDQVMYDLRSLADSARSAEKKWAQIPFGPDGKPAIPEGTQAPPVPNWAPVLKTSLEILRTKSKDLTVCAFLLEALTRIHGFAGLRDGAMLVKYLGDAYWGDLYPPFNEDEFEALEQHPTIAAISGLNGSSILPFAIDRIPLIKNSPIGQLNGIDYLDAFDTQLRVSRDLFEKAALAVPAATFDVLYEDAQAALAAYKQMTSLLSEKCLESHDATGPSSSSIEANLEDAIRRIRHISGRSELEASPSAPEEGLVAAEGSSEQGRSAAQNFSGPLQSRTDAYEMLQKVAEFFSRTEPHSPVSTALKRIAAWRNLTFPELMKELVDSSDARRDLFRLTGYKDEDS